MSYILCTGTDVCVTDDIHLGALCIPCINTIRFTAIFGIIYFNINIPVNIHGIGGLIHDTIQHHLVFTGNIHAQFSGTVHGESIAGGVFGIIYTRLIILGIRGNGIIPSEGIGKPRLYPCIISICIPCNRFCEIRCLRSACQKTGSQ